jgi:lipopolysaccharide transport system permease protein
VVVRFEGRTGKSRALNMGLAAARGRILALTDDDAIPAPDWLERVLAHFEHQPDTACVGGRVLLHDPADAPITIRLSAEPAVVSLREFSIENIPVLGCNVAFLAATLRSMGGFDTAIGPGSPVGSGDDADMLYRIVCSGFSIRYDPDIIVRHNHGRRTPEAVAQVIEKYQVGRGGFYCKYVIARDRRVLRWAYWELRRLVLTWLAGLGFSDSSRDAARQIRRLAVGAARYWVHGRPRPARAEGHPVNETTDIVSAAGAGAAVPAANGAAPLRTISHSPLHQTIELLLMITSREIMIRYKQSIMGFFWALLMPTLVVMAGLVVRAAVARMSGTPLAADVVGAMVVKALPWAFFVTSIRQATSSLTSNSNLVTRARCPRIVFPLSAVLSSLFDFGVAIVPLVVILAVVGVPLTVQLLWVVPLMLVLILLVTALGIVLATANLFYRDVKYIVEVFLMFAIFFTPVLFEAEMLGPWRTWVLLNPVAPLLEGFYAAVVHGRTPDLAWLLYSTLVSLGLAIVAWLMFQRLEPAFADNI